MEIVLYPLDPLLRVYIPSFALLGFCYLLTKDVLSHIPHWESITCSDIRISRLSFCTDVQGMESTIRLIKTHLDLCLCLSFWQMPAADAFFSFSSDGVFKRFPLFLDANVPFGILMHASYPPVCVCIADQRTLITHHFAHLVNWRIFAIIIIMQWCFCPAIFPFHAGDVLRTGIRGTALHSLRFSFWILCN